MAQTLAAAILSGALSLSAGSPATPSPSPSPSSLPSPAVSALPTAAAPAALNAGAHMRLLCPTIGEALFRTAELPVIRNGLVPPMIIPPPGLIDQAAPFVPVPLAAGSGSILLRDGRLGAGYAAWHAQGATAPHEDCELDVDDGSGVFRTRYVILAALPYSLSPDPPRADGAVGFLTLRHAGIRLLNF